MLHGRPQYFTDPQLLSLLYDINPSTNRKTSGIPVSCIVLQVSLRWHYPDQVVRVSVLGHTLSRPIPAPLALYGLMGLFIRVYYDDYMP